MARSKNSNLAAAARAKKDEFYTQLVDIENELGHDEYRDFFRGKTIFCNCDDPYESEFFKYFALNFNALGLKKLIVTCYAGSPVVQTELNFDTGDATVREHRNRFAYKVVITELKDWNGDGAEDLADIKEYILSHSGSWERLKGNGDFRSAECIELLREADVVVTNPPFSLFREYVAQLMTYKKKFAILGNKNAVTYKEIFPLIKANKIWPGYTKWAGGLWFISAVPDVYDVEVGNVKLKNTAAIWYTNIPLKKYQEFLPLTFKYSPERYPKYDNYDAIEVSKVAEIPCDYFPDEGLTSAAGTNTISPDPTRPDPTRHSTATASWACPSPSSTSTIPSSSKSSAARINTATAAATRPEPTGTASSAARVSTNGCSSGGKCNGVMGVPITFLDKYNPDQFEIIWTSDRGGDGEIEWLKKPHTRYDAPVIGGRGIYKRLFIRRKV